MPIRPLDMQGIAPGTIEGERRGSVDARQVTVNEMTHAGQLGRTAAKEATKVPESSESNTSRQVEEENSKEGDSKRGRNKGKGAGKASLEEKHKSIPTPFKGSHLDVEA